MASTNDKVMANHFDKFCKKVVLVNRDGVAYNSSNLGLPGNVFSTTITFDGNTGTGGVGDFDGSGNPVTLANVTGVIGAQVFGLAIGTVTGTAAGLKVGVDSSDATFLALATATDIDSGEFWYTGGQASVLGSTALLGAIKLVSEDIKLEATSANVSGGSIKFFILWEPLSSDANVSR